MKVLRSHPADRPRLGNASAPPSQIVSRGKSECAAALGRPSYGYCRWYTSTSWRGKALNFDRYLTPNGQCAPSLAGFRSPLSTSDVFRKPNGFRQRSTERPDRVYSVIAIMIRRKRTKPERASSRSYSPSGSFWRIRRYMPRIDVGRPQSSPKPLNRPGVSSEASQGTSP